MSCISAKVTRASESCDVQVSKTEGIGVVVMAVISAVTAAAADAYFRMTFMVNGVADSYIKDTTTGKYLFKGENL